MRNGNFVGKEYRSWDYLSYAITEVNNEIIVNSAYIVESIDMWYGRLGHVNFSSLKRLRNMRLIPNMNTENYSKCPLNVEAKFAKKPFTLVPI